jgi:hypothetical protein
MPRDKPGGLLEPMFSSAGDFSLALLNARPATRSAQVLP